MGGMGANMHAPGKSGITFDHILSHLQGELQKSRETGAELHSLTGAMNDIHEAFGGNLVRQSSYCFVLPIRTDHSASRSHSLHIHKLSFLCYPLNSPFPQKLIRTQTLCAELGIVRTSGTISRNPSVTRLPRRQDPLPGTVCLLSMRLLRAKSRPFES